MHRLSSVACILQTHFQQNDTSVGKSEQDTSTVAGTFCSMYVVHESTPYVSCQNLQRMLQMNHVHDDECAYVLRGVAVASVRMVCVGLQPFFSRSNHFVNISLEIGIGKGFK